MATRVYSEVYGQYCCLRPCREVFWGMLYWGYWYNVGKDIIVCPQSLMPGIARMSVLSAATWNHITMSYSVCHWYLYWCQQSTFLPSDTMLGMWRGCMLQALSNLMSKVYPATRADISLCALICPLKLCTCQWYLLATNNMDYLRWWLPLATSILGIPTSTLDHIDYIIHLICKVKYLDVT